MFSADAGTSSMMKVVAHGFTKNVMEDVAQYLQGMMASVSAR
jgi:hypothetical protein